ASDAPLTDDQLKGAKGGQLLHIPTALGGVVPTYNVPGVSDQLRFTPDVLAGIYLGQISRWNDPRRVTDNPALASVDQPIAVIHRSDGSGTTFIFTDYLSSVNPGWSQSVGNGTSVRWPVGAGENGNPGVADAVGKT